ncbi:MAG: PAS domain-containing protein, partial [Sphaerochaetaceae bacterium]
PVFENEGLFKLLGITKENWDSGYFDDPLGCVHPDDIENANQFLSSLNNEGDSADAVYRLRKGDGNYLWVHVAATLSNGKMYACYTDFEK